MWQDILITQKTYESNIKGTLLNGYIQTVSRCPIVIHMHTEEQILLIRKLLPNNLILHLDATGSVVRKKMSTYIIRSLNSQSVIKFTNV